MKENKSNVREAGRAVLTRIAERAGVSPGTASRVFNHSALIPMETKLRVLSAAREMKFRPRVGIRMPQVALLTEPAQKTVMGGYVCCLTQYICHALSRAHAGVSMITEDRLDRLADSWFDGIIGITWGEETIRMLRQIQNTPIVWFSDEYGKKFHCVCVNGRETGRIAGDYLTGKGHRRIAVIHDVDYMGNLRIAGFAEAMTEHGLDPKTNLLLLPNTMPLHLAVKQLIDGRCTAVWVTGEDMKVLEVNWLIQELAGKSIPEEISLLGFENPGISEFCRPSLTTLACPLREMAEKAVELALEPDFETVKKIELPVRICERNSVSAMPAGKGA